MQKLFGHFTKQWPKMNTHKELEKTEEVRFIYKTIICFETTTNKFEMLSHNFMENIKDDE